MCCTGGRLVPAHIRSDESIADRNAATSAVPASARCASTSGRIPFTMPMAWQSGQTLHSLAVPAPVIAAPVDSHCCSVSASFKASSDRLPWAPAPRPDVVPEPLPVSPPALAPVSPPELAPVSPPELAPVSPPELAPVSPPELAPVSPPELAPDVAPDSVPAEGAPEVGSDGFSELMTSSTAQDRERNRRAARRRRDERRSHRSGAAQKAG